MGYTTFSDKPNDVFASGVELEVVLHPSQYNIIIYYNQLYVLYNIIWGNYNDLTDLPHWNHG